jgi:hypothetical protein
LSPAGITTAPAGADAGPASTELFPHTCAGGVDGASVDDVENGGVVVVVVVVVVAGRVVVVVVAGRVVVVVAGRVVVVVVVGAAILGCQTRNLPPPHHDALATGTSRARIAATATPRISAGRRETRTRRERLRRPMDTRIWHYPPVWHRTAAQMRSRKVTAITFLIGAFPVRR